MPPNAETGENYARDNQIGGRQLPGTRVRDPDGNANARSPQILHADYLRHFYTCVVFVGAGLHEEIRGRHSESAYIAVQRFYNSVFRRPLSRFDLDGHIQRFFYSACYRAGFILYANSDIEHSRQILLELTRSAMIINPNFRNHILTIYPDF